jgi:uncharacterized membrane protein YgaE (UPF0421/DUF939 family)
MMPNLSGIAFFSFLGIGAVVGFVLGLIVASVVWLFDGDAAFAFMLVSGFCAGVGAVAGVLIEASS